MFYNFPNDALPLNKGDVAALRKCDVVSFHHVDERSYISATKRQSEENAFETSRKIACMTKFEDYGKRGERIAPKHMKCFEMEHNPKSSEEWQTIVGLIREGDTLTLYWQRDALRTEVLEKAGFCGDKLLIIVHRGEKQMRFLLDTYCGQDNTARMIQGPRKTDVEGE